MQQNFMNTRQDPLSLERIRNVLVRLEDTIIFCIIERSQFALNPRIYARGAFEELKKVGFEGSWLEWFLKETESFHAKARRFTSPDEYPFTKDLPPPILPPLDFPQILHPHPSTRDLNYNASLLSFYTRTIVPRITHRATLQLAAEKRLNGIVGDDEYEDDGNYGSSATTDVELLSAISKRVHYGKFVSESKFRDNPAAFIPHIKSRNRAALEGLITKPEVEKALLARLNKKAALYSADLGPDGTPLKKATGGKTNGSSSPGSDKDAPTHKIDIETIQKSLSDKLGDEYEWRVSVDDIHSLYADWIIPITKEIEVEYLIHRLDGLSEDEVAELAAKQK